MTRTFYYSQISLADKALLANAYLFLKTGGLHSMIVVTQPDGAKTGFTSLFELPDSKLVVCLDSYENDCIEFAVIDPKSLNGLESLHFEKADVDNLEGVLDLLGNPHTAFQNGALVLDTDSNSVLLLNNND